MQRKKLPRKLTEDIRRGIKQAAVKLLGYDQKAERAVKEYFDLLSERYRKPVYQLRIEIRLSRDRPGVYLFVPGEQTRELSPEHLIHIFGGNVAKIIPGLAKKAEDRVGKYLRQWAAQLQTSEAQCFFRLMVLAGKPLLSVGIGEKTLQEIPISEVVTFFS